MMMIMMGEGWWSQTPIVAPVSWCGMLYDTVILMGDRESHWEDEKGDLGARARELFQVSLVYFSRISKCSHVVSDLKRYRRCW